MKYKEANGSIEEVLKELRPEVEERRKEMSEGENQFEKAFKFVHWMTRQLKALSKPTGDKVCECIVRMSKEEFMVFYTEYVCENRPINLTELFEKGGDQQ